LGEAKRRNSGVGSCIYCGSVSGLSDEHVIPYGLSGDLILKKSSCKDCATITGKLEQGLLRGHWWPYRQFLGLKSRRSNEDVPDLKVKIKRKDGTGSIVEAQLAMVKQSAALIFEFDPPSIFAGIIRTDEPHSPRVFMKMLDKWPSVVSVDGMERRLQSWEELEIPVNFDAGQLCRFLAKIAHGVAISRRGLACCTEFYLPPIILGKTEGALTYVGGTTSPIIGNRLAGNGLNAVLDRVNGKFLTVYIQLFRDSGDPPPIYEVVVGHL
jgi:hypothetical protein